MELPPQGFVGTHYVDSGGCRFRQTVYNGKEHWAPLVNSQRQQLCGHKPTRFRVAGGQAVDTVPAAAVSRAKTTPHTIIAAAPAQRLRIPKGYRLAWMDGRLNLHRGPRTAEGDAQMARLWTDSVPARLIGYERQDR